MTEPILSALTAALTAADIPAVRAWPDTPLDTGEKRVCVDMKSCRLSGSGMGEYLGIRAGSGGQADAELYGLRLEAELSLTVLAPTAAECTAMLDEISAALDTLPGGLKMQALVCSQVKPDRASGMFRCEAVLSALACLLAEKDEETGCFTDFELKGVIRNADQ